jgi:Co/Zn/Cd efflux system component
MNLWVQRAPPVRSAIEGWIQSRVEMFPQVDPLAGIVGTCLIGSWSFGMVRDTGPILLDMNPDRSVADSLRQTIGGDGDEIANLYLWRLGPSHPGAIVSVNTWQARDPKRRSVFGQVRSEGLAVWVITVGRCRLGF